MKLMPKVLMLAAIVAMVVPAAHAQAPVAGTYKSVEIAGTIDYGRTSTSWTAPSGWETLGNVTNLESWDGPDNAGPGGSLGLMWRIYCGQVANVTVELDVPGVQRRVRIDYTGGAFWLDGGASWGGGDPAYTGTLTDFSETRSYIYTDDPFNPGSYVIIATNSDWDWQGNFDGYTSSCLIGQANDALIDMTDSNFVFPATTKPAYYPGFLDLGCADTRTLGRWGNMKNMTWDISNNCSVPVQEKSWGAIKSLYHD